MTRRKLKKKNVVGQDLSKSNKRENHSENLEGHKLSKSNKRGNNLKNLEEKKSSKSNKREDHSVDLDSAGVSDEDWEDVESDLDSNIKRKLENEETEEEPVKKKSKAQETHKFIKPPSSDEVNKFREIQFLQHSNLFRLQIEELLTNIKIKQKTKTKINSWLPEFSKFVKNLPKSKIYKLENVRTWSKEENLDLPLPSFEELPKNYGSFIFEPPKEVMMIGSFALDLATTHSKAIDIALVLPKEFIHSTDFYNGQWLLKRALYLSWLGKALKRSSEESNKNSETFGIVENVTWTYHLSPLRPILQLKSQKIGLQWKINMYPVPPGSIKLSVISPLKNNVSLAWIFDKEKSKDISRPPTPKHNFLCGIDFVMMKHFEFLKETLKHPNWKEGAILLRIWLKQRHFNQGENCVNSHILLMYMTFLAKERKISPQMSPYQIFRTVLLHLSQTVIDLESENSTEKQGQDIDSKKLTSKKDQNCGLNNLTLSEAQTKDRNEILPTPDNIKSLYSVIFIDPTGYLNLTAALEPYTLAYLKEEASKGLQILGLTSSNSFEALFIQSFKSYLKFDHLFRIKFEKEDFRRIFEEKWRSTEKRETLKADLLHDIRFITLQKVHSALSYALGDRADLITVVGSENPLWEYGVDAPRLNMEFVFGVLLNQSQHVALLTKGPSAETENTSEFRKFWGDLSQLRRFKDSSFHEAVLWGTPTAPFSTRRVISERIVDYTLEKHLNLPSESVVYRSNKLESAIQRNWTFKGGEEEENEDDFVYGTGEESLSSIVISYDKLARKLRSLNLPLQITTIQSTSDALRHSEVFPPLPVNVPRLRRIYENSKNKHPNSKKSQNKEGEHHQKSDIKDNEKSQNEDKNIHKKTKIESSKALNRDKKLDENSINEERIYVTLKSDQTCPPFRRGIDIQIFFEISGKWPEDLLAIKAVKIEFLIKIATLLRKDDITAVIRDDHLGIVWDGYVFNLRVCYRREIFLLRVLGSENKSMDTDTPESLNLEKEIEILPKLASSFNSLQSEYPSYSPSVRLTRRWMSSQLLLPHFPAIVVDLLVAYIYLGRQGYPTLKNPQVTLLRFMDLLINFDWEASPLFVNFKEEFEASDENEIIKKFGQSRQLFPAVFICTPCELRAFGASSVPTKSNASADWSENMSQNDSENTDWSKRLRLISCWSKEGPSKPILARARLVAKAALETYTKNIWNNNFDFKILFQPPLSDYHVLIELEKNAIVRRHERFDSHYVMKFKKYSHVKGEKLPATDFDPVQCYLLELRQNFGSHALFFHDQYGGDVIGVVWKAHVTSSKIAKMGSIEGHKLHGENERGEKQQIVDVDSIVGQFKIIGCGVVKCVKIRDNFI